MRALRRQWDPCGGARRAGLVGALSLGAVLGVAADASAVAVPEAVLDRLRGDVRESAVELRGERAAVAAVAQRQRLALAEQGRLERSTEQVRELVGLVPGFAQAEAVGAAEGDVAAAEVAAAKVQAELDAATETAARAQGSVLDAERRLRAIQRAADADPAISGAGGGTYRFGSGGPGVSAETLDRYLESKASPMAGSGAAFLKAGLEHDIDPRLLVAIAGAESYFGLQVCAPFNGWGWGCPDGPFRFASWAEAVDTIAGGLRENYLDDGLDTVGKIHLRYAPPAAAYVPTGLNYAWPNNVARFLVEQGGDPQAIGGVLAPSR